MLIATDGSLSRCAPIPVVSSDSTEGPLSRIEAPANSMYRRAVPDPFLPVAIF